MKIGLFGGGTVGGAVGAGWLPLDERQGICVASSGGLRRTSDVDFMFGMASQMRYMSCAEARGEYGTVELEAPDQKAQ